MADRALGVIALDLDHRLEKGRPLGWRKLQSRQGRMVLIAGGYQPDRRQNIPWGCDAFGAVGSIGGNLSPLPFPGVFFNLLRTSGNNQLTLSIIVQDGRLKCCKLDVTPLPFRLIPADHFRLGGSACQRRQRQRQQARRDGRG